VRYYGLPDLDAAFDCYTSEGGMPGSYVYKASDARYRYIADIFDTLIVRDIRQKYRIRNVDLLERLSDFMMDNISNITSARGVADALTSNRIRTNDQTVNAYMKYLCDAFAFYRVRRYDIRGKKYLASGDKYYLSDHSFKYAKLGTRNLDYGRTYENIVAVELMRRGWEVYAGVLYGKEIDFVAVRQNEKVYIQVSDDISSEATFRREYEPLLRIHDAYPKVIVARTRHDSYTYEGIKVTDISRWLLPNSHLRKN
jgi:predicted AAA+ superfamily ATPase